MILTIGNSSEPHVFCIHADDSTVREITEVGFEFDCFLINRQTDAPSYQSELIEAIARCTTGWVEVFGIDAEKLHDAIDLSSVFLKRQLRIGDGNPMTAWHDDMTGDSEIASYVLSGGQGTASAKIVIVLGSNVAERSLLDQLRELERCRRRSTQ